MNHRKAFNGSIHSTWSSKALAAPLVVPMVFLTMICLLFGAAIASAAEGRGMQGGGGFHGGGGGFHGGGGGFHAGASPHFESHMDGRFGHNREYFNHGQVFHGNPRGGYDIFHGGQHYWYDRGHWYRRHDGLSVVIGAPIGAFVPFLPYYYSTIWWGGIPYYYANDAYYTWDAASNEYEFVPPPAGIESGGSTVAPYADDIIVYPKNGQSDDQLARDRYDCHRSAVDQTGYDPTLIDTGQEDDSKRPDYMRAQAACLEARGYSVQ